MDKVRGSEWRKWDLHFHTPTSYDYGDKSITNEQIIDELARNEIALVAITDHHVIDLSRIEELQKLGRTKDIIVLPAIEILSDARGEEPIHYIGIFPENSNLDFIWGQIENNTEIKRIKGEGKKHNEIYCHLLDTIELIKKLGGIVTIHAGNKSNSIENITHSLPHGTAQKEDLANAIHVFEMGKESDCDGYAKTVIPYLKKKINRHIPMIICSDNHKVSDYKLKQNLWIKANPSFEGLKQILYEPEQRVRIQKDKPDFKEDKLVIDEVRFISSGNKFNPEPIRLNQNLNVIIGGKSSGKSILLYNIAKTLLADQDFLIKEGIGDKYKFRKDDDKFNFEVKTRGGFTQSMYRDVTENSIMPEIKYIPQNYLVKLAEPDENKKGAALNKIVRDLINEDPDSRRHYDDFISKVKQNDRKREHIIDSYFDMRERVSNLESELRTKSNREILERNILSNTIKVGELNKGAGLSPEQITEYNKLQKQLEDVRRVQHNSSSDLRKVSEYSSEVVNQLNSIQEREKLMINSLQTDSFKALLDDASNQLAATLQIYSTIMAKTEIVRGEERSTLRIQSEVSEIFVDLARSKAGIELALGPFQKNVELKKTIEAINQSIGEDKASLQAIDQLNKEISECKKSLQSEKEKLFKLYEDNYKEYIDIVDILKLRTVNLEKDGLSIEGLVKFNFSSFQKAVYDFSDGRRANWREYVICDESNSSLDDCKLSDLILELKKMFNAIVETGEYVLVGRSDKKEALRRLLDDYFFDYWEIKYKSDRLGEMSTGKASFVILMLIVGLSKSKAPILIDQPEDNLDNRSITTDLVEYLRHKKLERQIILVTHNPNIVVNADSENIIIANQKGQNDRESSSPYLFDYINGAIEDSFEKDDSQTDLLKSMGIREHIADIVEGGKDAFKKREEKYGF